MQKLGLGSVLAALVILCAASASAQQDRQNRNDPENSCQYAFDLQCDEPKLGTGFCETGSDSADCDILAAGGDDSCPFANDGECDETWIGTGYCVDGSDITDCGALNDFRYRDDTCSQAFDGICNEPDLGDGACEPRTDTADCLGRERPMSHLDHYFGHDDRYPADVMSFPWSAIGIMDLASGGTCSAVLVAPDMILTSAHCFYGTDGSDDLPVSFNAGLRQSEPRASAKIVSYTVSPKFNMVRFLETNDIDGVDWALADIDPPIGNEVGWMEIHAFTADDLAAIEAESYEPVFQAGYSWDGGNVMTAHDGCKVLQAAENFTIFHDCDMTNGDSGSPIFTWDGETARVIAVVSAFVPDEVMERNYQAVDARAFAEAAAEQAAIPLAER